MNTYQEAIRDFMQRIEQPTPDGPTLEGYPFELRSKMILEEAFEFVEACGLHKGEAVGAIHFPHKSITREADPDWPAMIDALCDLLYVTFGAAVAMGVDLDPFFSAVHDANLRKVGGPRRADGKALKPESWKPADVAGLLEHAIREYEKSQLPISPAELQDLLCLVVSTPPMLDELASWTQAERDAVAEWASLVHLAASDNDDVEVPPTPKKIEPYYEATYGRP
jgi:predicted HAD superfamily Cof-like phosphohydrolase